MITWTPPTGRSPCSDRARAKRSDNAGLQEVCRRVAVADESPTAHYTLICEEPETEIRRVAVRRVEEHFEVHAINSVHRITTANGKALVSPAILRQTDL